MQTRRLQSSTKPPMSSSSKKDTKSLVMSGYSDDVVSWWFDGVAVERDGSDLVLDIALPDYKHKLKATLTYGEYGWEVRLSLPSGSLVKEKP